jgi:multicomponent K+:H+ antiporter subunit A
MTLTLIVLLPFLAAMLPPLFIRLGRGPCALAAGVGAGVPFLLLLSSAGRVLGGEVLRESVTWMPNAGLRFSLMMDGLGMLFASLILGIGLLVIIYARFYLSTKDPMGRFYAFLLLFMGAMLGVVLSENLILLVTFWELTSLSSFLLIGFWKHLPEARQGARQALTITGMGGLCLLGGVVLLGQIVGSYELGDVLASGEAIRAHALYRPALVLILLGAFTKSAQFPFHFWLPHAMAAPTPVSAYLHSATMVKAGVFLLARLHPALAGSEEWSWLVTGAGIATMLTGAYIANFKHDLKGLLAYSTISHLGLITALFGIGTKEAAMVGVFHIMNHAAFKASLFMNAGIVDHEAGTRDIRLLGGLRTLMPITAGLALVASAAMAGLPPLNGFLSKEMFLGETLNAPHFGSTPWLLPVLATLGATFSVGYSIRYVVDVFFSKQPESFPHHPHDPPVGMWAPPALLVLVCVGVGLFPNALAGPVLYAAANATVGGGLERPDIHLWHGLNLPLLMSVIAVGVGALVWRFRWKLIDLHEQRVVLPDAKQLFERTIAGTVRMADEFTTGLGNGSLQRYIGLLLLTVVAVVGIPLLGDGIGAGVSGHSEVTLPVLAGSAFLLVSLVGTVVTHRNRIVSVIFLSAVGLMIALGFVYFSAPDLALTQLSVEVVTIILILLALYLLPSETPEESTPSRRIRDWGVASAIGSLLGVLTWMLLTRPIERPVGLEHLQQSYPGGGGTNVVNVILVDFRGFDTFGEVTVLGIAALGIYAMIDGLGIPRHWRKPASDNEMHHPLMLVVTARLLLPLALLVGIYMFLRGHNEPGGGFVAGLIVAIAIILQYLASGIAWTQLRMRRDFHPIIASGILVAGIAGVGAWVFGQPFLKSWYDYFEFPWLGKFELASAMIFDTGVFLTVVGAVLLVLINLGKLPEADAVVAINPGSDAEED